MGEKRNFAALDWVMSEISETLKEARQSLEAYVDDPKDSMRIRFCLTHIHQVHGSLEMAEFHGAALLAEEMEHTAQAIMDNSVSSAPEAQEVLMRSLLQLPIFLDHIRSSKEDNPARVMPLLNDLRAVRKQSYLSETNLFSPDLSGLSQITGEKHPVLQDKAKLLQVLKKLREMYQFAAASVLRGIKVEENLNYIEKVFSRLELLSKATPSYPLWEAADALVDGLKRDDIELTVGVKGLLRYLARELRIVGENAPAALHLVPKEPLLKNILYYVACADDGSEKIAQVKEKYQLKSALLGSGDGTAQESMLHQPDADAIRSVVVALQEDLSNIKHTLDLSLSGQGSTSDLKQVLPSVKRVADTLAVLGIGDLRKQMLEQSDRLERISDANSVDEKELLDTASNIIDIEHRLSAIAKAAGKNVDLNTVDEREVEIDNAKAAVINECIAGLTKAKEDIVEYYSNKWDKDYLENIGDLLAQVRGGLNIIPLARAGAIVESCAHFIQKNLVESKDHPSGDSLDYLADAIESVKYYLDLLSDDLHEESDTRLDIAEDSVNKLGFAIDVPDSAPVESSMLGEPPVFDTNLDEADEKPSIEPVQAETEADASSEASSEDSYQVDEEELAEAGNVMSEATVSDLQTQADEHSEQKDSTSEMSAHDVEEATSLQAFDTASVEAEVAEEPESDIDDEIIEIFIEEAGEVLETLAEYFPQWKAKESDQDALVVVRRAFHTLKGSGRMVEAFDIGELAWSVENMLNRVIDRTIKTTPHVFHIIEAVIDIVPALVKAFEARKPNPEKALTTQYETWAHQIAEGSPPSELEQPVPAPGESVAPVEEVSAVSVEDEETPVEEEETPVVEDVSSIAEDTVTEEPASIEEMPQFEEPTFETFDEESEDDVVESTVEEEGLASEISFEQEPVVDEEASEFLQEATEEPVSEFEENLTLHVGDIEIDGSQEELQHFDEHDESAEEVSPDTEPEFSYEIDEPDPQAEEYFELGDVASLDSDEDEEDSGPDPVLQEIFSQESTSHLETLEDFILKQREEAPLYSVPSDALQRALHTLKGSAKMAQVWPIAQITEPLENLAKELITFQVKVDADILQLLQDAVDYTRSGINQINSGLDVDIPKLEQFTARTQELRDIALGDLAFVRDDEDEDTNKIDPRMLSLVMAEEIALLLEVDTLLSQWKDSGEFSESMHSLIQELSALEEGAQKANLPDMANLSSTLRLTHQNVIEQRLPSDDQYFEMAIRGHEALLDMVDAVAAGQNVPAAPSEVLEALNGFAGVSDAPLEDGVEALNAESGAESDEGQDFIGDTLLVEEPKEDLASLLTSDEEPGEPLIEFDSVEPLEDIPEGAIELDPEETISFEEEHIVTEEISFESEEVGVEGEPLEQITFDTEPFETFDSLEEAESETSDSAEAVAGETAIEFSHDDEDVEFEASLELPDEPVEFSAAEDLEENAEADEVEFEVPEPVLLVDELESEADDSDVSFEFDGDDDQEEVAEPSFAAELPASNAAPDTPGKIGVIPGLIDKIDVNDDDFDRDILEVFLEEADELVEGMDEAIHTWESNWSDVESLEELKRILHTIKGGSRLSGLNNLGQVFHDYETMLIDMGEDLSGVDQPFFVKMHDYQDRILSAVKGVRKYMDEGYDVGLVDDGQDRGQEEPVVPDTVEVEAEEEIVSEIKETEDYELEVPEGLADEQESDTNNIVKFEPKPKETPPAVSVPSDGGPGEFSMPQVGAGGGQAAATVAVKKSAPQEVVKVSAELLEELVNLAGETSINRSRLEQYVNDFSFSLDEVDSTLNRLQDQLRRLDIETEAQILFRQEQMEAHDEFDPLEMDRYSHLQQLSRSLTESASDLKDLKTDLGEKLKVTETLLVQQSRINTTLQEGLMRSRMVPFSRLVPRLRRIVRQVAAELGKNVSFELDNVEGELDRSVLERMVPPFEHMLRNAVDHGIETPEERINAGKAESGRIVLTLAREGGDVIIRLADDGRGVDLKRVREKAIERELMSPEADLSDFDIMQFILHAGFSTAESVTQISGRGVGMDVVNAEIKQLGGSVTINSSWGKGTEFVIRLPFTLSVNRALMVAIGSDHYAVPLSSIEGIVRVSPFELEHYYANPEAQFEYANENYHVRYLGSLFHRNATPSLDGHVLPLPVLLVRSAEHTMALQVDAVMGSREIVVKSLGAQFSSVAGLSGATVMGDGSVVVILDPHAIVRQEIARAALQLVDSAEEIIEEEEVVNRVKTIMVVDDSVTVRKVTTRFLEREGFEVITAKDGVDALRVLQDEMPDLMLLDIEMPRMDGFEVAKTVRTTKRWEELPIIMITSRTGDKHREHAMSLGVNNYLGKPYQEDILLEAIADILEHGAQRS